MNLPQEVNFIWSRVEKEQSKNRDERVNSRRTLGLPHYKKQKQKQKTTPPMQKILENVLSEGIKGKRAGFPPSASMQGST